jgi:hypothetical protein
MKHIKMSHRCLHRRFSRVVAIESNESRGPMRVYIGRSESHEQLAESKA